MTQPKNARKVNAGRLYEWRAPGLPLDADPERFWSVTTILKGGVPAPNLMAWGMKSVAAFAVANYRQLYAMCLGSFRFEWSDDGKRIEGHIEDPDALVSAVDWLKGAPYRERERRANAGTAIHEHAEAYALGKPMPVPEPEIADQVAAYHRFLEDFKPSIVRHDSGFWMAEATVYNRPESYAGTLDAIMDIPGLGVVLVDYKSAKGVYAETAMQLAAYRFAEFIGLPDGTEWPMRPVDGCAVLHLHPNAGPSGYAFLPVIADEQVFTAFKYTREVFRWAEETSKGVIGQPMPVPTPTRTRKPRRAAA